MWLYLWEIDLLSGGWGWLNLEFVEKVEVTLTSSGDTISLWKTYNYFTYVVSNVTKSWADWYQLHKLQGKDPYFTGAYFYPDFNTLVGTVWFSHNATIQARTSSSWIYTATFRVYKLKFPS